MQNLQTTSAKGDFFEKAIDKFVKGVGKAIDWIASWSIWNWMMAAMLILLVLVWALTSTRVLLIVLLLMCLSFVLGWKGIPDMQKKRAK
jgi:hypothetical protein